MIEGTFSDISIHSLGFDTDSGDDVALGEDTEITFSPLSEVSREVEQRDSQISQDYIILTTLHRARVEEAAAAVDDGDGDGDVAEPRRAHLAWLDIISTDSAQEDTPLGRGGDSRASHEWNIQFSQRCVTAPNNPNPTQTQTQTWQTQVQAQPGDRVRRLSETM